ncbi:MAG TPA: hypothetical protein VG410_14285 [Solirubrobacteraceae bacterium]|nr:hypothetical protein [Solirubrobacteraceae bacterium]
MILGSAARRRNEPGSVAFAAGVVASGAVGGAAAVQFGAKDPLAVVVFVIGLACALYSWRRSIVWMLYYMPFSGLLPLALYPHQAAGTLFKDAVFIGPAYVAAALLWVRRKERFEVPRVPRILFGAFTALVLVEAFNPRLANHLLGAIGAAVWLFYIPLLPLGYHMFSRLGGLQRVLKWMTILALVPCVLGILEAAAIYTGHENFVYSLYGPAASAISENFFALTLGSTNLSRISSIFTFVAQYYFFASATIAVAYAAWRGNREDPTMRWLGPVAIGIALLATLTSGLRAAFVFDPLMLLLIALLEGLSLRRLIGAALAAVVAIGAVLLALGIPGGTLASITSGHTSDLFGFFGQGFSYGLHHTLLGVGAGADTDQARYAFSTASYSIVYATLGGQWYESWYLKAFLELGIAGLLVFALLLVRLLWRSFSAHRLACAHPEARSISAGLLALFIWTLIFCIKTAGVDQDPLDAYLWLFLGVQWWVGDHVATRARPAGSAFGAAGAARAGPP